MLDCLSRPNLPKVKDTTTRDTKRNLTICLHLVGHARAHEVLAEFLGRHGAVAHLQARLHAVHEVHGANDEITDGHQHRREEHPARGAAVDDGHQREYAQDDADDCTGDTEGALVRTGTLRFSNTQHDESRKLKQTSVADGEVKHDDQHQRDNTSSDQRHICRSARRVQLGQDVGQVSVAGDSVEQLAHAEHERVEARDQSDNQNPRETRGGAVVAEHGLVASKERRRVDVDLIGAGADHRVEDDGAERDGDKSDNGGHEATGHVLGGLDRLVNGERQLLNAQVEPQRERSTLKNAVPSLVVPVAVDHPVLVRDLCRRADVEYQQHDHRHDGGRGLHAEGHFNAHDVERDKDEVAGEPPDRTKVRAHANDLSEVRADTRCRHSRGDHNLQTLGDTSEKSRRLADTVQSKHVWTSTMRHGSRQLSDGERQQHVLHRHHRQQNEETVETGDQRRLPAEEVAADDGAYAQRPEVRGLGVALGALALHNRTVAYSSSRRSCTRMEMKSAV
ncbi:hypothetical protein ON010_g9675 [Phytophthora cinnamomi]|nr:hypothetical protein ON010_g9675 [Phytophthora cinnamomi]